VVNFIILKRLTQGPSPSFPPIYTLRSYDLEITSFHNIPTHDSKFEIKSVPPVVPTSHTPIVLHSSAYAPKLTTPGPGQIPSHPHPIPKTTAPPINFQSISSFVGKLNWTLNNGFSADRSLITHTRRSGTRAPTATKRRAGSNLEEKGRMRKFWIFDGWSMPANARLKEKWTAMKKEEIDSYHFPVVIVGTI
jgi:hypothetical protein